jgi:hypothetical protein
MDKNSIIGQYGHIMEEESAISFNHNDQSSKSTTIGRKLAISLQTYLWEVQQDDSNYNDSTVLSFDLAVDANRWCSYAVFWMNTWNTFTIGSIFRGVIG